MEVPTTFPGIKPEEEDVVMTPNVVQPPVPRVWEHTPSGPRAPGDTSPESTTPYKLQFRPTSIDHVATDTGLTPILRDFEPFAESPSMRPSFPPPRELTYGPNGDLGQDKMPKTVEMPPPALNPATKRKREDLSDGQAEPLERVAPTPIATPVARDFPIIEKPVVRKKKSCADAILVCEQCHTTSNVSHNPMMVCKGCFEAQHKLCVYPTQEPRDYLCYLCRKEKEDLANYNRLMAEQQAEKQLSRVYYSVENQRRRNMVGFAPFNKPQHVGFFAGDSTHEERAEYFSQFKVNEMVNLLLFSEEHVEGGVLANLLASVANKHPELPIFNRPDWANDLRTVEEQTQEASAVPTGAKAQATTSLRKPKNKRHRISAIRKVQDGVATIVEPLIYDTDVHTLPSQWPRTGEGLYAQLKREKDDMILFDDKDEEAFSHFKGPVDSGPRLRPTFNADTKLEVGDDSEPITPVDVIGVEQWNA